MTMDNPTPGSTPPPTWTPDPTPAPVVPPPVPPASPAPFAPPPTSFAPVPVVATTTARNRASTGTALLLVGALVAIGGVAFAVGRVTAPAAAAATNNGGFGGAGRGNGAEGGFGNPGGFGGFGGAGGGAAGVSISGTVVSIDGSTIQVKLANGTTETLNLASTVTYRDSTTGTAADVTPGATVQISLALGGGGPTASGAPRPSGGFGGLGNATVGTITVVK